VLQVRQRFCLFSINGGNFSCRWQFGLAVFASEKPVIQGQCVWDALILLAYKATTVSELPDGVWGVAESQLTNQGLSQFRSELKFCKSKFKFWPGKPAQHKSSSLGSVGGKCMGVAVLTNLPARNMQVNWPDELHREARTHCTAVYVHGIWMKVGVFYGYAKNPKNILTRQRSDELLSLITESVVYNSFGPRVITCRASTV